MAALLPPGWPRPRGYANGVSARGRMVFVAGMIGWDAQGNFVERGRPSPTSWPCSRRATRNRSTSCA